MKVFAVGNASAVGAFLLGLASLVPGGKSTAQNLTGATSAAKLSAQAQKAAFAQAILQAVQQDTSSNTTGILISAAVSAQHADAVADAFSQVGCATSLRM